MSALHPSSDPNDRFRSRRAEARRRVRLKRSLAAVVLVASVLVVGVGATLAGRGDAAQAVATGGGAIARAPAATVAPRPMPIEVRGVHVTSQLLTLPGKLREYVGLAKHGLNTIELDIKDEGGEVGFVPKDVPLASKVGAARNYYDARSVAKLMRRNDIYLIGRVVVFQDPYLAAARPDLAIRTRDGSTWKTAAGLAWVNPYDRRVWDYPVSIAESAAKAGFDEIMFDYVRFPSDGDVGGAVYPGKTSQPQAQVIADFAAYAKRRLAPYGVRVSGALFGLAASDDLPIGQKPRLIAQHFDSISPMAYPSLYGPGQLGISDPYRQPGETMFRTLADFKRQMRRSDALLVPWVQDFSGYGVREIRAQIDAARLQGSKGFLLWNAAGVYTKEALAPVKDP